MTNSTRHRDAVETGLTEMRARYEAMGASPHAAVRAERELTLAFTEAAMRSLAENRDAGTHDRDFGGGFTAAVGNVLASLAETLACGNHPVSLMLVGTFVNGAMAQAIRRIADQSPESFNQVMVDLPAPRPREGC